MVESYFENSIKRNVYVLEKIIVVHVVIEKDLDMVERELVEVDDDFDSYFKKKEEIVKNFETNKNFLKGT